MDDEEGQNILLASGDVIFFPMQRHTISVSGQVQRAGLIDYEPDRKVRYYITKAGGYLYDADKRNARLVRARTGVREKLKDNLIVEVGDEIWVPQKERINYWVFFQETVRTAASVLALVIAVQTVSR